MYVLGLISQFNLAWSSLTVALLTTFASIEILTFIVFCCHSVPHVLSLLRISSCSLNTSFPSSQSCPPDPSPAHADSRCSLTLPSPPPSTTDMHKRAPAANNRGFMQGGHTADPAGRLSKARIWTWVDIISRPRCFWGLLKKCTSLRGAWVFTHVCLTVLISLNKGIIQSVTALSR